MIENVTEITVQSLLTEVQNMFFNNYRFVTATCVDNNNDTVDILYHFDKDYKLTNFRMTVQKGSTIPSISKIYFCAILVENEIQELFGVKVTNMAIDYGGHMLLTDAAPESPMLRQQITIVKKGEENNA
jgi:Ni,Fe-hydrogenase III component G